DSRVASTAGGGWNSLPHPGWGVRAEEPCGRVLRRSVDLLIAARRGGCCYSRSVLDADSAPGALGSPPPATSASACAPASSSPAPSPETSGAGASGGGGVTAPTRGITAPAFVRTRARLPTFSRR